MVPMFKEYDFFPRLVRDHTISVVTARTRRSPAPPAPRLVGIETNPGPPKAVARTLGDLGALLGASIARTQKKKKTVKKKVTPKTRSNDFINSSVSMGSSSVPVSLAPTIRQRISNPVVTVPFDLCNIAVNVGGTGFIKFGNDTGSNVMDFDINGGAGGAWIFGQLGIMAGNFRKFRFTSLSADYIPACPTSTGGVLCFAYTSDPATPNLPYPAAVGSLSIYDRSIITPVWKPCSIDLSAMDHSTWLFLSDSSTAAAANYRIQDAGSLLVAGSNVAINSVPGFIRLRGVVQLADMTPAPAIGSYPRRPAAPSQVTPDEPEYGVVRHMCETESYPTPSSVPLRYNPIPLSR